MATTTLEAPVKERPPEWEMPPVKIGAKVFWYEHGNRSRTPQPATVENIAGGQIACRLFVGGLYANKLSVRHIDDPFLLKHPNCASEPDAGGWDYSTEYKEEEARWVELNARLAAIEKTMAWIQSRAASAVCDATVGQVAEMKRALAEAGLEKVELKGPAIYDEKINPEFRPPEGFTSVVMPGVSDEFSKAFSNCNAELKPPVADEPVKQAPHKKNKS